MLEKLKKLEKKINKEKAYFEIKKEYEERDKILQNEINEYQDFMYSLGITITDICFDKEFIIFYVNPNLQTKYPQLAKSITHIPFSIDTLFNQDIKNLDKIDFELDYTFSNLDYKELKEIYETYFEWELDEINSLSTRGAKAKAVEDLQERIKDIFIANPISDFFSFAKRF